MSNIRRPGRPTFRRLDNNPLSRTKNGVAKSRLGMLEARMKNTGQKFGVWHRTLSDGTKIKVAKIGTPAGPPIRIYEVETSEEEIIIGEPPTCIIEVGCMSYLMDFEGAPSSLTTFPLPIYVGEGVQAYFDGAGTVIPNQPALVEYILQEELALPRYRTCTDESNFEVIDQLDWPDEPPAQLPGFPTEPAVLVSDEAYESIIFERLSDVPYGYCTYPALYGGMLRLAAQAKLGAGRNPASLGAWISDRCGLDSRWDGLFRDSNWVYWLFRTDSTGVKAQRMKIGNCAICTWQALKNDEVADEEDVVRFETVVLASLTPDRSYANVQLLEAADMEDIYTATDGSEKFSLGVIHEWHYSYGEYGDVGVGDVHEAVIVTHYITTVASQTFHRATLARVEFDLTGATPVATVVIDEQDVDWELSSGDFIFYPTATIEGLKLCYIKSCALCAERGVDAPIYAFYRKDGLEVFRYTWRVPGTWVNDGAHNFPGVCGCGGATDYTTVNVSGNKAGVAGDMYTQLSEVHLDTFQITDSNAIVDFKRSLLELGGGAPRSCNGGTFSNIPTQVRIQADITACSGTSSAGWPGAGWYHYDIRTASASGFVRELKYRAGPVRRYAIIPQGDSEAIYLAETVQPSLMLTNDTIPLTTPASPIGCQIKITDNNTGLVIDDFPSLVIYAGGLGIGTLPCSTAVNALYDISNKVTGPTGTNTNIILEVALATANAVLRIKDGMVDDGAVWNEWYNVYADPLTNCTSKTQWTQTSFNYGDTWFSVGPSATKLLSGEYDIVPTSEGYKVVFIGWD